MTLQRFLNAVGDSRWTWLGNPRWRPSPDRAPSFGSLLVPWLTIMAAATAMGTLLTVLIAQGPMRGSRWPLEWMLRVGAVVATFSVAVLAVAWIRRASQLRAAGLSQPPPRPPARWWQRWLIGPLYAALVFAVTPLALWLSLDNALGTRAWRNARADLAARGEPLSMEQLRPPRPSDDLNFAMTPLLRPLVDYRIIVTNGTSDIAWSDLEGLRRIQAIDLPAEPTSRSRNAARQSEPSDGRARLEAYARALRIQPVRRVEGPLPEDLARRYGVVFTNPPTLSATEIESLVITNPAADVLQYLRRFEPEFQEIAAAIQRPHSWFTVPWADVTDMNTTHLGPLKKFSSLFRVRSAARLGAGDVEGAFADAKTALRLAEALADEPLPMPLLVRIAQSSIAVATVWEGLTSHQWTDPQLLEFQAILAPIDLREPLVAAFRGERIVANSMYESMVAGQIPQAQDSDGATGGEGAPGPVRMLGIAPIGFLRQNQVHHNRAFDLLIGDIQQPAWPASLAGNTDRDATLGRLGLSPMRPHTILPSMALPGIIGIRHQAARIHVTARLAGVACALERHRIRTGTYPERLEDLVPALLDSVPLDPMNRQPFRYARTNDGWFRLWSVGLNGQDDGGIASPRSNRDAEGDWVWPLPLPSTDSRLF